MINRRTLLGAAGAGLLLPTKKLYACPASADGHANAPVANARTKKLTNLLGTSILGITNNGAGLIRVQVDDTSAWTSQQQFSVFNAPANTGANNQPPNRWKLTVVDATHVDLQGSTFTNAAGAGGTIGYVLRPPWSVAGVDYPVGINAGVTLKNPSPSGPTPIPGSYFPSDANTIEVDTNNNVIDGYDFSLNGGYRLLLGGTGNTVRNCFFSPTTSPWGNAIQFLNGGTQVIEYCAFQCNKHVVGNNFAPNYYIDAGNTSVTVQYCWFTDGFAMFISGGGAGVNFVMKYNFLQNEGYDEFITSGVDHSDIIQLFGTGATQSIQYLYNTYLHNTHGAGANNEAATQGLSLYVRTSANCTYSVSNNTFVGAISPPDSGSLGNNLDFWILTDSTNYANLTTPGNISQNYCDNTVLNGGSNGPFGQPSFWYLPYYGENGGTGTFPGRFTGTGNRNMVDGTTLNNISSGLLGSTNIAG